MERNETLNGILKEEKAPWALSPGVCPAAELWPRLGLVPVMTQKSPGAERPKVTERSLFWALGNTGTVQFNIAGG